MERIEIIEILKRHVSQIRLDHCLRVEETAVKLAERFMVDPIRASSAALLHDLCREYNEDLLLKLAGNFGIVIGKMEEAEPLLLHGMVAAAKVDSEYGITDSEVKEAIAFHITGSAKISRLAQLIFVADFIEPGRGLEKSRHLLKKAFSLEPEQLLLKVYNATIQYVLEQNHLLHPRSAAGRNELILKGVKEI